MNALRTQQCQPIKNQLNRVNKQDGAADSAAAAITAKGERETIIIIILSEIIAHEKLIRICSMCARSDEIHMQTHTHTQCWTMQHALQCTVCMHAADMKMLSARFVLCCYCCWCRQAFFSLHVLSLNFVIFLRSHNYAAKCSDADREGFFLL